MGLRNMEKPEEGLITSFLKGTPLAGLGLMPKLSEREIIVELTEQQFKDMVLANADARAKQSVDIKISEGKITLKIRLF